MSCPNCSAEASTEQKFCRFCGMELQAVAELINEQTPMVKPVATENRVSMQDNERC
jgi:predicted amidophosphoribosyltransferase